MIFFYLETCGSWNIKQDVHSDGLSLFSGKESSRNNMAEVLLSIYPRKQVNSHNSKDEATSTSNFRTFCMIPYNQTTSKITNTESFRLKSCIRRTADSIDKRFCFDIIPEDR